MTRCRVNAIQVDDEQSLGARAVRHLTVISMLRTRYPVDPAIKGSDEFKYIGNVVQDPICEEERSQTLMSMTMKNVMDGDAYLEDTTTSSSGNRMSVKFFVWFLASLNVACNDLGPVIRNNAENDLEAIQSRWLHSYSQELTIDELDARARRFQQLHEELDEQQQRDCLEDVSRDITCFEQVQRVLVHLVVRFDFSECDVLQELIEKETGYFEKLEVRLQQVKRPLARFSAFLHDFAATDAAEHLHGFLEVERATSNYRWCTTC